MVRAVATRTVVRNLSTAAPIFIEVSGEAPVGGGDGTVAGTRKDLTTS